MAFLSHNYIDCRQASLPRLSIQQTANPERDARGLDAEGDSGRRDKLEAQFGNQGSTAQTGWQNVLQLVARDAGYD
jgi:hypothetical protein